LVFEKRKRRIVRKRSMENRISKKIKRQYRHKRIRKNIFGCLDRPRLCVHKSLKNFYAQIIDDQSGRVLLGISTLAKDLRSKIKNGGNANAATLLGEVVAVKAKEKGIIKVCFDRGGYMYHGCVKAFAEAARKGGMEF